MDTLKRFFAAGLREATTGTPVYHAWMALLTFIMCCGAWAYTVQLRHGLGVTGMHDHVSWGFYISNFTFLVGVAAAAVILVMPAYVLKDQDFRSAVLIGEAMAVGALVMAIAFVIVDVGGPARLWHLLPIVGRINFPRSLLAWDILVLNGYLVLNASVPFYLLYCHWRGREANKKLYIPVVLLSIGWAVSLHLVTAFLYAGLPARPYWNTSLMGPRFLATAFTAGPALMILVLTLIRRYGGYPVAKETIEKLSLVVTVASQICVVMSISELFVEFYRSTHHGLSARYLFFGIGEKRQLVPYIWSSLAMIGGAAVLLTVHRLRERFLHAACVMLFIGILIEKGLGTIIPGFIPEPWGRIDEYAPTWVEFTVGAGIWALGSFVFTVLAKVAIPIEMGRLRDVEINSPQTS